MSNIFMGNASNIEDNRNKLDNMSKIADEAGSPITYESKQYPNVKAVQDYVEESIKGYKIDGTYVYLYINPFTQEELNYRINLDPDQLGFTEGTVWLTNNEDGTCQEYINEEPLFVENHIKLFDYENDSNQFDYFLTYNSPNSDAEEYQEIAYLELQGWNEETQIITGMNPIFNEEITNIGENDYEIQESIFKLFTNPLNNEECNLQIDIHPNITGSTSGSKILINKVKNENYGKVIITEFSDECRDLFNGMHSIKKRITNSENDINNIKEKFGEALNSKDTLFDQINNKAPKGEITRYNGYEYDDEYFYLYYDPFYNNKCNLKISLQEIANNTNNDTGQFSIFMNTFKDHYLTYNQFDYINNNVENPILFGGTFSNWNNTNKTFNGLDYISACGYNTHYFQYDLPSLVHYTDSKFNIIDNEIGTDGGTGIFNGIKGHIQSLESSLTDINNNFTTNMFTSLGNNIASYDDCYDTVEFSYPANKVEYENNEVCLYQFSIPENSYYLFTGNLYTKFNYGDINDCYGYVFVKTFDGKSVLNLSLNHKEFNTNFSTIIHNNTNGIEYYGIYVKLLGVNNLSAGQYFQYNLNNMHTIRIGADDK